MQRKAIVRIAGFLLVLVVLLKIFSILFDGGYWFEKKFIYDRNARLAAFGLEQKDQINILNIGDSLSTTSLAPMELYRDYGYTTYNLGQDLQTPIESYFALRTALKTQPIKVVLYEGHNLFFASEDFEFPSSLLSESLKTEFPFLRFHYVWLKYWKPRSIRHYFKGFLVNDGHDGYTGGEYYDWDSTERHWVNDLYVEVLKKTVDLCRRKGIYFVIYSAPSPVCYNSISIHNTLADIAEELGVDYLDANYDRDKIEMDWNADTHDCGDHLNLSGSRRMTTYLGDYLAENTDLPDHRDDPDYQAWNDLWDPYAEEIIQMENLYYTILEDEMGFYD